MCYDDKAIPPTPPGVPGQAHGEELVLTSADSNRFAAYVARPATPARAQVLIYPDIRGLHQFYKTLALRFAELGVTALAVDYFGRSAGLTSRDDSFEYMPHVQQLRLSTFFADVDAGLAYLREGAGAHAATFTVGFCLGGGFSLLTATRAGLDLAGVIGFYAGLSRKFPDAEGTALELAPQIKYPVLGLFGGADKGIPVEQVHELDERLDGTGIEHKIVIYPGATHSFFDKRSAEFAEASDDAWKQVIEFITAHTR